MRIFISSIPKELEPFQVAAADLVAGLGHEPVLHDPASRRGLNPVASCKRQISRVDALLAIVGWRRGPVPPAALGGDGLRPWSFWEVRSAFALGLPVAALLAGESFPRPAREERPEAHAVMSDFRGELARLAAVFNDEDEFRRLLRVQLRKVERASQSGGPVIDQRLRRFAPPEVPAHPYPLLLPYSHPELMAGRGDDLAELRRLLAQPLTVVGLHAASGTGKSSLLAGALVPVLRAEGRPVALVRHPTEGELAAHLLADLIETADPAPTDSYGFVDSLAAVHRQAGAPPLLVVDQFEDVLKEGAARTRATLGTLLAASAQRLPGFDGPPCRWLLAYRQEFHGQLVEWLGDVLREARAFSSVEIETLPHDLSDASRFAAWPLLPLATPAADAEDPVEAAARIFLEVIEKPLQLRRSESEERRWPWIFAPGHAEGLAHAFAEARIARPNAPLVPELQVVLAHLLERAGEPSGTGPVTVEVPAEPAELIDRALEDHLRRALDSAFADTDESSARIARSRALLVLRELADAHGQRREGRASEVLAQALGDDGREILEKLSTPRTRLVLQERQGNAQVYVLAHDRLAEVLVQVVDGGYWAGLGVDAELLGLRRFVVLQSRLYGSGDIEQATTVSPGQAAKIEVHRDVLLWNDTQRAWWDVCRRQGRNTWRRRATRRATQWSLAAIVLLAVTYGTWTTTDRWVRRQALLQEVASGEPEVAFAALDELTGKEGYDPEELLKRLRLREKPFDVFESGLGGIDGEGRAEVLVRIAELALPLIEESPEDPVLTASLVWALDFFVRDPHLEERALALRDEALAPLRRSRPPPPRPGPKDPSWVAIPGGTFWMGAPTGELPEHQVHQVTLSPFRMLRHEVTNAEYRQLVPAHTGDDALPVGNVTWYEAYTYAAWLGGRLPTESEWEYAARAGCAFAYCRHDGSEATLDEVAWWAVNSTDTQTGQPPIQPVMQREPNPWGMWDIYGNVFEWTADWYGPHLPPVAKDPPGPTSDPSLSYRAFRGGSVRSPKRVASASFRGSMPPESFSRFFGLRVVMVNAELPAASRREEPDEPRGRSLTSPGREETP